MSEFEFLRNLPLGQSVPGDSFLHRLDPRVRIVMLLGLLAGLVFSRSLAGLGVGLGLVLVGLVVGRFSIRFALRGLITPLPFLLILAVLQVFLNAVPDEGQALFTVLGERVTWGDLWVGGMLLLRFAGLVLGLSLATLSLPTSELTHGLEKLLHPLAVLRLPVRDWVVVVQVTLRFLPFLAQAAERIAKAQASRGAGIGGGGSLWRRARQALPLVIPLFLTSLRRAENMALAMDARAYGSGQAHTSMTEFNMHPRDAGVLILVLCVESAMFWL